MIAITNDSDPITPDEVGHLATVLGSLKTNIAVCMDYDGMDAQAEAEVYMALSCIELARHHLAQASFFQAKTSSERDIL